MAGNKGVHAMPGYDEPVISNEAMQFTLLDSLSL
ncbi:hypothetical protein AFEL58S_00685 [Afipia felis]